MTQSDLDGDLVGSRIGKYRVDARLGRGGFGEVYRAWEADLERHVAIKRPIPGKRADPRFLDNVLREARKTCKVKGANVATVHAVIEHAGSPLIVMEYVEGRTLAELLPEGPLSEEVALDYAIQIARALRDIHEAGLIHRDLKPGNVMVTAHGDVKVLDFGLAQRESPGEIGPDDRTPTLTTDLFPGAGTPDYMSPEQLKRLPLAAASDLFALGIVIYEALTGRHPHRKDSQAETTSAILQERPGGSHAAASVVGRSALGRVCLRLLEKEPERRYASAGALLEALQAIASGRGPARPFRRGRTVAALAAVALVAGVAGWLGRGDRPPASARGRPGLAILPIEDLTGDADGRAPMVRGLIEAHLGSADETRPIGRRRVDEVHATVAGRPLEERLPVLAAGLNASWVLSGQLYREGQLVARLDLHDLRHARAQSVVVTADSATGLAEQAARRVRTIIHGAEVTEIAWSAVSDSDEAQKLYETARRAADELDYLRSRQLLERALEVDGQFILAHVTLAEVLDRIGNQRDARQRAERALEVVRARGFPDDSRASLLAHGVAGLLRLDVDVAARAYERLVERYPDDPDAVSQLARVYASSRMNRPDEALTLYDRALEIDPLDPTLHLERARLLADLRRYEQAEAGIERAEEILRRFDIRGGAGEVASARGHLRFRQGDWDEAGQAYLRAERAYAAEGLELQALDAQYTLHGIQLMRYQVADAIVTLEKIVPVARRAGHDALVTRALSALGAGHYRAGQLAEAESVLDLAVSAARELKRADLEHSALNSLAGVLIGAGKLERARAVIEREQQIAAELGSPMRRGHALIKLAEWHRAAADPEAVTLTLAPLVAPDADDVFGPKLRLSALQLLTQAATDAGRLERARETADAAVALAGSLDQPERTGYTLCLRARVLAALGAHDGARADLDSAVELLGEAPVIPTLFVALRHAQCAFHLARGEWRQARNVLGSIPKSAAHAPLYLCRAQALAADGRQAEADATIRALRELIDPLPAYLTRELERARRSGS